MNETIDCYKTNHMKNNTNLYKNCQYYPGGKSVAFRYESETFLGHWCIPASNYTNNTDMIEAFKNAFFNDILGD